MQRFISKEDLLRKIRELSKEFEVIGPKELLNKGIFYQNLADVEDLYLGEAFTVEPIKKFFLEPSTWLFSCRKDEKIGVETIQQSDRKMIIIGVRPCETRGLALLDKVFDPSTGSPRAEHLSEAKDTRCEAGSTLSGAEGVDAVYKDNFYINNRKRALVIGLACTKPDQSCFCTSMGGSPVESRGMDVLLFDSEGGFIADIISDKGKEILGSLGEALDEKKQKSWQLAKEQMKNSLKKKINPPESLDSVFESDYWDGVSRSCISCGICTYLCPTCHCFDLVDEQRKRLRCYDGCSFPDFTQEASGENPRPSKKERYRQRVFHKFDYFKKNFGENLCVGCGRCIRYCPVKIDIADIADKAPVSEKK